MLPRRARMTKSQSRNDAVIRGKSGNNQSACIEFLNAVKAGREKAAVTDSISERQNSGSLQPRGSLLNYILLILRVKPLT